jgi:beta-glucosidase-like glycosyl hydrolase
MNKKQFFLIVIGLAVLCVRAEPSSASSTAAEFRYFFRDTPEQILDSLSIEEKIGQILIYGFYGKELDGDHETWMAEGRLGNIKIFLRNVASHAQLRSLTDHVTDLAFGSSHGIPPFIATDMEGGTVNHVRYRGIYLAPAAGLLGAVERVDYSHQASRLIALTLYNHGVNMNFAPCVDILTNPHNRVIGTRSYSTDPGVVTSMAQAFIDEHRKLGILTTAKHFPGHGMTAYDSHLFSATVDMPKTDLYNMHVSPYHRLIENRTLDGVMVSHITYGSIDPLFPATLSSKVINGYLRGELGFRGIVVTDDLEMQGTATYAGDIVKTFLLSFRAGNDLFLLSHNKDTQQKLLREAVYMVKRGILSEDELDDKVLRILRAKQRYLARFYGTHGGTVVQKKVWEQAIHENIRLTADGVVLISSHIGISTPSYFRNMMQADKKGLILSPSKSFGNRAKRYLPLWDIVEIGFYPDKAENSKRIEKIEQKLKSYDVIVLGFANERHISWARAIMRAEVPFAILSYDNPQYALQFAPHTLFIATCFAPYNPATDALFLSVFKTGRFSDNFPYRF